MASEIPFTGCRDLWQSLLVSTLPGNQKVRQAFVTAVAAAVSLLTLVSPPAFANSEAPATGRQLAGGDAGTSPAGGKHSPMVRAHSRAIRFVYRRRDLYARGGPPPAGGEALYRWCRQTVIIGHGWPTPTPDRPHQVSMNAWHAVGMIDACVQSHGEIR
jgi:hypothetical protein